MISDIQKRFILFLGGCILVRLLLVYIARSLSLQNLRLMGYMALLPALGFMIIYFGGLRKTGGEVFGERIWWNSLRPLHGFLYLTFGLMAINGRRNAWYVLLLDVMIGLVAFLYHHLLVKV